MNGVPSRNAPVHGVVQAVPGSLRPVGRVRPRGRGDLADLFRAIRAIRLGVIGSTTAFGAVRSRFESWGRSQKEAKIRLFLGSALRSRTGRRSVATAVSSLPERTTAFRPSNPFWSRHGAE
jgi:hypothetical protein